MSDIFLLGLIGYLGYMVVSGRKSPEFSTIFFPALAFVGTFFLSAIVGFFKVGGSLGLEGAFFAVKYLEYFLIFFVTVNLVRDDRQVGILLKLFLWLSSIAALLLIATKIFDQLHLTLTIEVPSFAIQFHHLRNPRATLPFAKGFGPSSEFLELVIPLALFSFIYSSRFRDKAIYLTFSAILGAGFVLTGSRGPMAALFLAIVFVVPFLEKKLIPWIIAGILGVGSLSFFVPFFSSRIKSILILFSEGICSNNSMCVRVTEIWPKGLNQFMNHPIVGKGVASFPTSDTQYIRLLADQGIIGLGAFVVFIGVLLIYLVGLKRESVRGSTGLILSSAMIVSVVALLINGITATAFEPVRAMEPFWFLLGLVFALEKFKGVEGGKWVGEGKT